MIELGIEEKIKKAIDVLYKKDKFLIDNKVHEQAICTSLACYLKGFFPEYDVDVEYNREGIGENPKKNLENSKKKPDIIIHKRGIDKNNIMVIEAKCHWNREKRGIDKNTLKQLKKKYKYQFAFFLEFEKEKCKMVEVE